MFADLEIFRMSSAMAIHAGKRQSVIAGNVANADTPGYRVKGVQSFTESYRTEGAATSMRASRQSHLHGYAANDLVLDTSEVAGTGSPNGNSVSLETELLKAAETKSQHDRAIAIYKSGLSILRLTVSK